MKLSSNTDFFQKKGTTITEQSVKTCHTQNKEQEKKLADARTSALINLTITTLIKCGFTKMAEKIKQIYQDANRERFVVSVVGEFSRGKSTFLNNLLGNMPMLPTGNLPTTALLTRIRYAHQNKMAVFDGQGNRIGILDIKPESWEGLTANNFGEKDPTGSVIIGIDNEWLGKNNIELIDCPGAGDLSEERAKQIGYALNRTNGAIIAIDATRALSQTEKIFIKNRILGRNTPFTMLIVNKLDLVELEERNDVIKYIKNVLALEKMEIPVYIPTEIEMPDDTYKGLMGLENIKKAIVDWIKHPSRQELTQKWIKNRIQEVVQMAIQTLSEQQKLFDLDEEKRTELIRNKKIALDQLELEWGNLSLELQKKANACYDCFLKKANDYTNDIIERLQYEASHASHPGKWWTEDYSYRLKCELANMSVGLENAITYIVTNDAKWFNQAINQKFNSMIQPENISITDKDKYKDTKSQRTIEFENLNKKRNMGRLGVMAISLLLAPLTMGTSWALVTTMGISTIGALFNEEFYKKKTEAQREELKNNIAKDIPNIIIQATENSEKRIQRIYDDMLKESDNKRHLWYETQLKAIDTDHLPKNIEQQNQLKDNLNILMNINAKF